MARNVIQRLRRKPKDTRNTIAMSLAGAITAFVFVVWAVVSMSDFGDVVENSKEGASAFSQFFDSVKTEVASVREELPDMEEMQAAVESSQQESVIESDIEITSVTNTENVTSTDVVATTSVSREVRIATTTASTTSSQ